METTRSVHLFKIPVMAANKNPTVSKICIVGRHEWKIEFHEKTTDPRHPYNGSDWIMSRVKLISNGARQVAALFSCRLVDPRSPADSLEKNTSSMFYENHSQDIFLIRRSELWEPSRRYLKDGFIIVQCAITVLPEDPQDGRDPNPKDAAAAEAAAYAVPSVPSSDLHKQFGELLLSQVGADITFVISGECIAAHRCVLAARSPVFMAELFGNMKEEASSCVEINDMEVEVFRVMLHFIYTDTVPELDQMKGKEATVIAQHLLEAADRYGLERLKVICVEKMCTNIGVDTVATTLALAEQHGCSKLKSRCMEFISASPENLQAVAATEGYKHLEASCPLVLTELLSSRLSLVGNKM